MSTTSLSFFTPIKYGHQSTSILQKVMEFVDDYFHLRGRVALVVPGKTIDGSEGVQLQPEQAFGMHSLFKVMSYTTCFFNLLISTQFLGITPYRRVVQFQMILNSLPIFMMIAKVILRSIYRFHIDSEPSIRENQQQQVQTGDDKTKDDLDPTTGCINTNTNDINPLQPEQIEPIVHEPQIQVVKPAPDLLLGAAGAAKWKTYIGDPGTVPLLPSNIDEILNKPCPFWPGKKVHETHLLTFIPETIDGKPYDYKVFAEHIYKPLQGHKANNNNDRLRFGSYTYPLAPAGHWVLMTREVVPGSLGKSYADQKKLVHDVGYQVPTVLDFIVSVFLEYVTTKTDLYGDSPLTYTRCQEKYDKDWQAIAMGHQKQRNIPNVKLQHGDSIYIGMAAIRIL
jgi:hypothetical protein